MMLVNVKMNVPYNGIIGCVKKGNEPKGNVLSKSLKIYFI